MFSISSRPSVLVISCIPTSHTLGFALISKHRSCNSNHHRWVLTTNFSAWLPWTASRRQQHTVSTWEVPISEMAAHQKKALLLVRCWTRHPPKTSEFSELFRKLNEVAKGYRQTWMTRSKTHPTNWRTAAEAALITTGSFAKCIRKHMTMHWNKKFERDQWQQTVQLYF